MRAIVIFMFCEVVTFTVAHCVSSVESRTLLMHHPTLCSSKNNSEDNQTSAKCAGVPPVFMHTPEKNKHTPV